MKVLVPVKRVKTLKVSEPPKRGAGVKVPDVATLVHVLAYNLKRVLQILGIAKTMKAMTLAGA